MFFRKKLFMQLFITVMLLFIPTFVGAVNFSQIITLEKNGSGIIKFVYTEKESLVKEKNFVVGNLPFSKEKSADFFNSTNTFIRQITVDTDPKNQSLTRVIVSIKFNDINAINKMKALSEAQVSLKNTDSGSVFVYLVTPAFTKSNSIVDLFTVLTYNGAIKSTNGKIEGNNIQWFRGNDSISANKNMNLIATLESDKKTTSKNSDGETEKSCGLFGLELPLLLLGGLVISQKAKKNKK